MPEAAYSVRANSVTQGFRNSAGGAFPNKAHEGHVGEMFGGRPAVVRTLRVAFTWDTQLPLTDPFWWSAVVQVACVFCRPTSVRPLQGTCIATSEPLPIRLFIHSPEIHLSVNTVQ